MKEYVVTLTRSYIAKVRVYAENRDQADHIARLASTCGKIEYDLPGDFRVEVDDPKVYDPEWLEDMPKLKDWK